MNFYAWLQLYIDSFQADTQNPNLSHCEQDSDVEGLDYKIFELGEEMHYSTSEPAKFQEFLQLILHLTKVISVQNLTPKNQFLDTLRGYLRKAIEMLKGVKDAREEFISGSTEKLLQIFRLVISLPKFREVLGFRSEWENQAVPELDISVENSLLVSTQAKLLPPDGVTFLLPLPFSITCFILPSCIWLLLVDSLLPYHNPSLSFHKA